MTSLQRKEILKISEEILGRLSPVERQNIGFQVFQHLNQEVRDIKEQKKVVNSELKLVAFQLQEERDDLAKEEFSALGERLMILKAEEQRIPSLEARLVERARKYRKYAPGNPPQVKVSYSGWSS